MKVLREAVGKAVQEPDFKAASADLSTPIMYLDAPEFQKFWDRDARRLAGVVRTIGRVEEQKQQ
jgi:tripartite-type tricarboxylate transporter receptor subunit TctC